MCNCNHGFTNKNNSNKVKTIIKRLWEKSQIEDKNISIKKINKQ